MICINKVEASLFVSSPQESLGNSLLFSNLLSSWLHPLPVFTWAGGPWSLLERCHLCCNADWMGGADEKVKVVINTWWSLIKACNRLQREKHTENHTWKTQWLLITLQTCWRSGWFCVVYPQWDKKALVDCATLFGSCHVSQPAFVSVMFYWSSR